MYTVKTFKDAKGVRAAVKRANLSQLEYEVIPHDERGQKGFTAMVSVELEEDLHEVRSRGFRAKMKGE